MPIATKSNTGIRSLQEVLVMRDYYPFGMETPGQVYVGAAYRYGFNTQEKVDEIGGSGNHNTALFWEYDTRLGRRWEMDPFYYSWKSPYACFSDSPIVRVDPEGSDDYFSNRGRYLGSSAHGTKVRIVSGTVPAGFKLDGREQVDQQIGEANSQLLSGFLGNDKISLEDRGIVATSIANYYAKKRNFGSVKMGTRDNPNCPAYTSSHQNQIFLNSAYNRSGLYKYDDYNAITNMLVHEEGHRQDNIDQLKTTFQRHSEIYLKQMEDPSFLGASSSFQRSIIASFANHVMNMYVGSPTGDFSAVSDLLESFNIAFKGQYKLTFQGPQSPEAAPTMQLYEKGYKSVSIPFKKLDKPTE